jgi:hypothetical protein
VKIIALLNRSTRISDTDASTIARVVDSQVYSRSRPRAVSRKANGACNPPHEVPMLATPLGELELAAVLRDAHTHVFGEPPTRLCLATSWAQCALEHAHKRAIFCHNIGNVTAFGGWPGDYYTIRFKPGTNPHDAPVMKFRAHDDFIDGARDYWHVLQGRYASVLPLFDAGAPTEAAYRLHQLGYYTAPADPYARAMTSLYGDALAHVLPLL